MNSILFDIGATKIRIAYSENGEFFEEPKVIYTPKDSLENFLKLFEDIVKEVTKNREIKVIVGGMTRSIPFITPEELKIKLSSIFGVPVILENDAAVVGLGEAHWGAGRNFNIVAYITVSTGVGGARIVGGKIDERAIGFEPGKQIINISPIQTLEDLISGKALEARTNQKPKDITDQEIWDDHARKLAIGLNNIIAHWSPDCVVLGGSMITGNPSIPMEKTEEYLKEVLKIYPKLPIIKKADLGDFGGLYGALVLIKKQ
ncbi:MAG: ROK family protein [Parcubacteria group bacterium]|jgi:glucokinase|nr:ROK family protein [Parcubacteria group bacterium]